MKSETTRPAALEPLENLVQRASQEQHVNIRHNLDWLRMIFSKVVQGHSHERPETVPAYELFLRIADDLERHMEREEKEIFPRLTGGGGRKKIHRGGKGKRQDVLQSILWEHDATQQDWEELRKLTGGFKVPEGSCGYLEMLCWGLGRLETALYGHLELELDGIYPRAEREGLLARN